MDAVTGDLLDRTRVAQNVSRMVVVSLLLHGALLTAIAVLPHVLRGRHRTEEHHDDHARRRAWAGAGRLQIAQKAVQQAAPDTAKPKTDTPPACRSRRWSSR